MKITNEQVVNALQILKDYEKQIKEELKIYKKEINNLPKFIEVTKETSVYDLDCSVRLRNILKAHSDILGINYDFCVGELSNVSESKFKSLSGVGSKYINELKEICLYANIILKP